jgi:hypothetical protein
MIATKRRCGMRWTRQRRHVLHAAIRSERAAEPPTTQNIALAASRRDGFVNEISAAWRLTIKRTGGLHSRTKREQLRQMRTVPRPIHALGNFQINFGIRKQAISAPEAAQDSTCFNQRVKKRRFFSLAQGITLDGSRPEIEFLGNFTILMQSRIRSPEPGSATTQDASHG